jgi:hypothetical protein
MTDTGTFLYHHQRYRARRRQPAVTHGVFFSDYDKETTEQ